MYCNKCGKEISENALFCSGCGAKIEQNSVTGSVDKQSEQARKEKSNKYKWGLPCIIIGGIAIVIAIVVAVYFMNRSKESQGEGADGTGFQLYDVTVDEIDVYAENRQPNERDYSLEWDKTLFYFLEDVGPEETDGQIEHFDVTRRQLRNAESGNLMEYEIYTNPDTGKIHKIVSIEQMDDSLEIVDYYYLDTGEVNFIYKRSDSVYTPTYATIDKTGERYYFNNDTLVKWRWIDVPRQVEQVVLQYDEENESYTQHLYNEISNGGKESFDEMEKQMLNAAYNTYDAISNSADYGNVKGYVLDENGEPLADAEVEVYAGTDSLGVLSTDENGYYESGISFYEEGYQLDVSADGYNSENIYQVVVEQDSITTWVDTIYLTSSDETEYSVEFVVYDGDVLFADEDGNVIKTYLADAEVVIRRGLNNVTGEEVVTGSCDENGELTIELENGVYTAEVTRNGYVTTRQNIVVTDEKTIEIPLVAELEENQLKIVLTWEGESDLDSCLFTPDKSSNGDMAYINAVTMLDEDGNQLNYDSKDGQGVEVIYIADTSKGTYKYYVSDYANCLNGNLSATDMLNMNIQVTVYDENGFVTSYTMPRNLSGVVWEVFEVKNGNVIGLQHSYTNLEGKDWWSADKDKFDVEVYQPILNEALEKMQLSRKDGDELTMLSYSYFYYDFNQDGCEELLLYEEDGYSWGTTYIYSCANGEVQKIWERSDESYSEYIIALTEDGVVIWGTLSSAMNMWASYYRMEGNSFVFDSEICLSACEVDGLITEYVYSITQADGTNKVIDKREEYDRMLTTYLEEDIIQDEMEDVWILLEDTNRVTA